MTSKKKPSIESVLDINSNNIWSVSENEVASLWEMERKDPDFANSEEKVINTLRTGFEVIHFNPDDEREAARFSPDEWAIITHSDPQRGCAALRRKQIRSLADLTYENIKHLTAPMLLELIDRNFGGGWDSIPLSVRDIIESQFDISTSTLPASRIHAKGGTLERKVKQGFEVLEVAKGTWTEAIFAKKKEIVAVTRPVKEPKAVKPDDIPGEEDDDIDLPDDTDTPTDEDEEDPEVDPNAEDLTGVDEETLYSCYSAEAEVHDDDEEDVAE